MIITDLIQQLNKKWTDKHQVYSNSPPFISKSLSITKQTTPGLNQNYASNNHLDSCRRHLQSKQISRKFEANNQIFKFGGKKACRSIAHCMHSHIKFKNKF